MKTANKNISILGCGWLGLPLAKKLVAEGFRVNGSTTSGEKLSQLESEGINAFQIELTEKGHRGKMALFLEESEILIVDIPPGLRQNSDRDYMMKMNIFLTEVKESTVKYVLYVSSTSVFRNDENFTTYTENDLPNESGDNALQLNFVEGFFRYSETFTTTVLRLGGLCGKNRHPVKYLSGRENINNSEAPVNLVHRNDCIALIEKIIETKSWGGTFHGVYPKHPSKKEYYTKMAKLRNLKPPRFSSTSPSVGKIISSAQTQEKLHFKFRHKP